MLVNGNYDSTFSTPVTFSTLLNSSAETSSADSRPGLSTQPSFRCRAEVPARTWKGEIVRTLLRGLLHFH